MIDLDKLKSAIEQIWNFVIPPLIRFGMLLGLLAYVTNRSFFPAASQFPDVYFIEQPQVHRFLTAYNLVTVFSAAVVLAVLFFLNVMDRALHIIGLILPVNYSYYSTFLYQNTYAFEELSQFYETTMRTNDLVVIIEQNGQLEKVKQTVNGQIIQALESKRGSIDSNLTYVKSLMIVCVLLLVTDLFKHPPVFLIGRVFAAMGVLLIGMLVVFIQAASAHLSLANHLTSSLLALKLMSGDGRKSGVDNGIFKERISSSAGEKAQTWWFVRFRQNGHQWTSIIKAFRWRHYDFNRRWKDRQSRKRKTP